LTLSLPLPLSGSTPLLFRRAAAPSYHIATCNPMIPQPERLFERPLAGSSCKGALFRELIRATGARLRFCVCVIFLTLGWKKRAVAPEASIDRLIFSRECRSQLIPNCLIGNGARINLAHSGTRRARSVALFMPRAANFTRMRRLHRGGRDEFLPRRVAAEVERNLIVCVQTTSLFPGPESRGTWFGKKEDGRKRGRFTQFYFFFLFSGGKKTSKQIMM